MANGRLLDGDRRALREMVNWDNLYRANPFPLSKTESLDMYWQCFTPIQRDALHTLMDDEATQEYVATSSRRMEFAIQEILIHTDDYAPTHDIKVPVLALKSPEGAHFPEKAGWGDNYPLITADNPYYDRIANWIRAVSNTSHVIDVCSSAVRDLAEGYSAVNTYGQLKRIWPDIIQVAPDDWQQHLAAASRSSRLPDGRSQREWRRIRQGFETVSNYAVQAFMLKDSPDDIATYNEPTYDSTPKWDAWCGPEVQEVARSPSEVKMPWE